MMKLVLLLIREICFGGDYIFLAFSLCLKEFKLKGERIVGTMF